LSAEYTEIVPVTGVAVLAAVAVATALADGDGVAAPPHAAATVMTPSPLRERAPVKYWCHLKTTLPQIVRSLDPRPGPKLFRR